MPTAEHDQWVHRTFGVDPAQYADAPGGEDAPGLWGKKKTLQPPPSAQQGPAAADVQAYGKAVAAGEWPKAAGLLNAFGASDIKAWVAKLPPGGVAKMHKGALDNPALGQNSAVALATTAMAHPVLGTAQSTRAAAAEKNLSNKDGKDFRELISKAAPKEKDYINKGLAAGHTVAELTAFAAKIAGKDAKWLQDNLSLTGNSEGKGVKQQWSMSCNATTVQAVRGEMDPLYALKMHEDNPKLTQADNADGAGLNPTLAADQKALLETAYPDGKTGGLARNRGDAAKVPGRWNTDLLNNAKDATGISYTRQKIGVETTLDQSMTEINDGVAKGMPVPIVIGNGTTAKFAHYVLVTATDPGPPRYYSIHDPATGDTVVRSEDQVRSGQIGVAGWNQISALEKPDAVAVQPKPKPKSRKRPKK